MLTLPNSCGPSTLYFEHCTKPWVQAPSSIALHWTYAFPTLLLLNLSFLVGWFIIAMATTMSRYGQRTLFLDCTTYLLLSVMVLVATKWNVCNNTSVIQMFMQTWYCSYSQIPTKVKCPSVFLMIHTFFSISKIPIKVTKTIYLHWLSLLSPFIHFTPDLSKKINYLHHTFLSPAYIFVETPAKMFLQWYGTVLNKVLDSISELGSYYLTQISLIPCHKIK